jgi:hypothetical protein
MHPLPVASGNQGNESSLVPGVGGQPLVEGGFRTTLQSMKFGVVLGDPRIEGWSTVAANCEPGRA